jgi:hypothetical protein
MDFNIDFEGVLNYQQDIYNKYHDKSRLQHAILSWNLDLKIVVFKHLYFKYYRNYLNEFETFVMRTLEGNLDIKQVEIVKSECVRLYSKK